MLIRISESSIKWV